jgi:excisionase family DNA binding protein
MFDNHEDLVTIDGLTEMLFIGKNQAYKLLSSGSIKACKLGRAWRIPKSSVEEFIMSKCISKISLI